MTYKSWDHDDLPSGFLRQRRNLMLFNVTGLVYVWGGGDLGAQGQVSLFGSGVVIHHPWVLILFYFIGLAYAGLRFTLYSADFSYSLRMERIEAMKTSRMFQKLILDRPENPVKNRSPAIQLRSGNVFRIDFSREKAAIDRQEFSFGGERGRAQGACDIPVKEIWPIWIWAHVRAAWLFRTTTDVWVPLALLGVLLISIIWRVL